MKKNKTLYRLYDLLMLTIGVAIVSASLFFFMIPSNLAIGSITGLAVILNKFIPLPISVLTMIMNVVLLIIGFLFIGKDFGAKTVYASVLVPVMLGILERVLPNNTSIMGDPFIDMVCHVFFMSIGLAILFNRNASSGGIDIVAKLMNKYMQVEIGKAMSVSGLVVALLSVLTSDMKIVIISVLGTYLNGIVVDWFIFGSTIKKRVCIISEKEEEIREFLINGLHSGASVYELAGAYNMEAREEIVAIVDKSEYLKLMRFLEKTDPDAFVTIYNVNKIICRPKVI